ncbi:hypothetical protein L596_027899 [Steinernema carpocapsae]|uniref:Copine C-terminal domain-containing protein n=1 Tax=Steinernema carpocapsae TaxID=34508 RepID=A0A4U5LWV3_STECR|nr:hypothetical protein L596_027899 [Steinernema carpocapsae]
MPQDGSRYQILLIITDGVICDFEKTVDVIITGSSMPLSIIIIGVGNEDFTKMDELDSDDELLSLNGRRAQRDIVQFVPLRNFLTSSGYNGNYGVTVMARLAKEVLAEVPGQVTSYMNSKNIVPKLQQGNLTASICSFCSSRILVLNPLILAIISILIPHRHFLSTQQCSYLRNLFGFLRFPCFEHA